LDCEEETVVIHDCTVTGVPEKDSAKIFVNIKCEVNERGISQISAYWTETKLADTPEYKEWRASDEGKEEIKNNRLDVVDSVKLNNLTEADFEAMRANMD